MSRHRTSALGADHEEDEAGMERWLLTYADMITLLLALFVVLFAMSSINVKKFQEFKTGVVQAFAPRTNPIPGGTGLLQQNALVTSSGVVKPPLDPMARLQQELQAALARAGLSQDATVTVEHRGVVVRMLTDKAFFATGSADLGPVGARVVDVVAATISGLPDPVQVEGYTDNQPILGGPYHTNFELSGARAMTVVDRLAGDDHIPADRLAGVGYGETRPVFANDTPAHRAANRRVDVVILSAAYQPSGPGPLATPGTPSTPATPSTAAPVTGGPVGGTPTAAAAPGAG